MKQSFYLLTKYVPLSTPFKRMDLTDCNLSKNAKTVSSV